MTITINNHKITITWIKVLYLITILSFIAYLAWDMSYNTAFVDEAIYATIGEEVLRKIYWENAISWMGGSYLYPVISALFNRWNGLTGTRLFSMVCTLVTGIIAGKIGKQLGGKKVQLISTFLFLFSATSLKLGQLATYDTPSIAFTALSFYSVLSSRYANRGKKYLLITASSILFTLAVLSKYIAIFFLPAILLALFQKNVVKIVRNISLWLIPFVPIIGYYVLISLDPLVNFFTGSHFSEPTTRIQILEQVANDTSIFIPTMLIGVYLALKKVKGEKKWLILVLALGGTMPITYHLASANIRSLWKHLDFTLFFWAPIAGWVIYKLYLLIASVQNKNYLAANLSQLILTLYLVAITSGLWASFGSHWRFQRSWPSATKALEYLEKNRKPNDKIFAEASAIYKYHLFTGFEDPSSWTSTWYLNYKGQEGIGAMKAAINNREFDWIILNNYFTNYVNDEILPDIEKNYKLVLADTYKVSGEYDNETFIWEPK